MIVADTVEQKPLYKSKEWYAWYYAKRAEDPAFRKRNADRMREFNRKNPRSGKNSDLKKRYGITLDEYEELLEQQGGVCAICLNVEARKKPSGNGFYSLAVDHDHVTGAIRGLLCSRCNVAIGMVEENPGVLGRAIEYLRLVDATTI